MTELSVVIPVYNEDKNILDTFKALKKNVPVGFETIVVYDFDGDTTVPIVQEYMKSAANVRLIKNSVARGPSGAIRTGMVHAQAPYVLVTMADLCDDLTQIPQMIKIIKEHEGIVCPSRYCRGGEQKLKESPKKWIPRIAGFLLKFMSGLKTYDPTNSFKLYSSKLLKELDLKSTVSFSVTLEIVAKAHCLGYAVTEIPTVWKDRTSGKSNFKLIRSLFTYLPWFGLAVLGNPLWMIPKKTFQSWFKSTQPVLSQG